MNKTTSLKLMGKKRGMTQLFDDKGNAIVCTIIELTPNVVTQVKKQESDGYNAVQIGFERITAKNPHTEQKRVKKPQRGHFLKHGIPLVRYLAESRVEDPSEYTEGQEIKVDTFNEIAFVDVTCISKGKGYQGLMKKNNYAGGPAAHGSGFHRRAGSTGMRSTPGRCLPGGPRPSQMGNKKVTTQNLQVVLVDPEQNIIAVKGAVPGANGGLVYLNAAKKKTNTSNTSGVKLWQI